MNNLKSETRQQLLDNVLSTVEDIESANSPFDILDNALCIEEYTIDNKGNYKGGLITVATGGPHIEINTQYDKVIGYWGSDRFERSYNDNCGLYETLEELMPRS